MSCCVQDVPFYTNCFVKDNYAVKRKAFKNKYLGCRANNVKAKTVVTVTVQFKTHEESEELYNFLDEHYQYFTTNIPIWGGVEFVECRVLNWDDYTRNSLLGNTSKVSLELEILSDKDTIYIVDADGKYVIHNNKLVRRF